MTGAVPVGALLAQAAAQYGAGGFAAAADLARQALLQAPGHPAALHLLAAARIGEGALDEGADMLEALLRRLPQADEVRLQLARVRAGQGRHAAVRDLLDPLVARRPDLLAAYRPLAAALWELGERDGAVAVFRQLLARRGDDAEVQRDLGQALRQTGAAAEAAALLARAVAAGTDDLEARIALAEARADLARAVPAGGAEDAAAREAACAALALDPREPQALFRLGAVLGVGGALDRAIDCLRRARAGLGDQPALLIELANLLSRRLDPAGAAACYRAVLARHPDHLAANVNLAMLDLGRGDFAAGWPRYEWRRRLVRQLDQPQDPHAPPWIVPPDLTGRTVRLVLEQGHGDTLQFIRYVPLLAARGARVEVDQRGPDGPVQPGLAPLLAMVAGVAQVIGAGQAPPPADAVLPLLSLPLAFGTDEASIPAAVPYLRVPPERAVRWRDRLGADPRPRIGIVWSGSPTHANDRLRSIPLPRFLPLLRRRDLAFHVLADRLRDGESGLLEGVATLHPEIGDFADTAALVAAMDLVITVDSAVAHLSGGLGRPTWVLLPHLPDWRWLMGRTDSPWYPTLRLFRQTAHLDWDGVLARVGEAIDATFQ